MNMNMKNDYECGSECAYECECDYGCECDYEFEQKCECDYECDVNMNETMIVTMKCDYECK